MTQISKRQLGKQVEDKVYSSFWSIIAKTKKETEAELFFGEFFTDNEKVNFAKRLSIAILLKKGYDWRAVEDIVKVSRGTIAKISPKMSTRGFILVFEKLEREENWRKFWKDVASTYRLATHGDKVARFGK